MEKTNLEIYLKNLHRRNKSLSRGDYAKIANKFNVSREWVRQKANLIGLKVVFNKDIEKLCDYCGNNFSSRDGNSKFCSRKCSQTFNYYRAYMLVLCETCGLGVLKKTQDYKRSKSKIFYCSRECYSQSEHLKTIANKLKTKYGDNYFIKLSQYGNKAQNNVDMRK